MKQPTCSIHFSKDIDGVDGGVFLLDHILEHAPKTIEAWVKLDTDSAGGAI